VNGDCRAFTTKKLNRQLIPDGRCGNKLTFFRDNGNMYRFAGEYDEVFEEDLLGQIITGEAFFVENGPIRSSLKASVKFHSNACEDVPNVTSQYVREYSLIKGEPFIRMKIHGGPPLYRGSSNNTCGYSVFTYFPTSLIDTPHTSQPFQVNPLQLIHGTPYHWTNYQPEDNAAYDGVFRAVHNYWLAMRDNHMHKEVYGALYHKGTLAWAIGDRNFSNSSVFGTLFRNNPIGGEGAAGTDNQSCTHEYALRTPYQLGLNSTTDLTLLREAKEYQQPLQAYYISSHSGHDLNQDYSNYNRGVKTQRAMPNHTQMFDGNFSLFATDSGAIISACKMRSQLKQKDDAIVIRLYQATNSLRYTNITLPSMHSPFRKQSSTKWILSEISALEDSKPGASEPEKCMDSVVQVLTRHALTTFQLG